MYIVDILEKHAQDRPDSPFITFEGCTQSFSQVMSGVQRLSCYLLENNIAPGDRVIMMLGNTYAFVETYLALTSIAAIPVVINDQSKYDFVSHIVNDTEATTIITNNYEELHQLPINVMVYPDLDENSPLIWRTQRSKITHIFYTSGTTGRPKGVMISNDSIELITDTIIGWTGRKTGDVELFGLAMTSGVFWCFLCHVKLGNHVYIEKSMSDIPNLFDKLVKYNITGLCATPALLKLMIEFHETDLRLKAKNLRYLIINSCPLQPDAIQKILQCIPNTRFFMYYGLTEAPKSTVIEYNLHPNHLSTVGRPVNGAEVKIKPRDNSDNNVGEILIRGKHLMLGYWGFTREEVFDPEGWFATGDIGKFDSEGFLQILGRVRELINVDGMKCLPSEIEEILLKHESVKECVVFGVADNLSYERAASFVVLHDKWASLLELERRRITVELKQHCKKYLEKFKIPSTFHFCDSLPRNDLGKIKRLELKKLIEDGKNKSDNF